MNYDTSGLQQRNQFAEENAVKMAASIRQVRDRPPIEVAMEAMEKAVAGLDATIAALDGRLSLVKRSAVAMSGDNRKEESELTNNSPLAAYMQKMTTRMNDAQRRLADICTSLEL